MKKEQAELFLKLLKDADLKSSKGFRMGPSTILDKVFPDDKMSTMLYN